ncbi:hypothetical protein BDZ89DRAFT_760359 [Hymenopellis radicata]|nr:hypothetical protein BDZ89DRAFT_760359 [Hymenopellis radicata]
MRALSDLFPARVFPPCDYAEDALILALRLDLEEEIRKRLWYHVVTTREFHDDENESSTLPVELRTRCTNLLDSLISHFTALLFTPPATSHMGCTDVFAESWMTVVISPSLESHGVYRPLESLDMMKKIDWGSMGVCQSCVADKHEEWNEEADVVWKLLGEWLQE